MEKSIECSGKTIDLAIAAALEELDLDRDSVSVEVLENPKSGFLGLRSTPARIKVTYEEPVEESPVETFLYGLLKHLGSDAGLIVNEHESGRIDVELTGGNLGMLIGRRGDTLDAIQHLTNYCVNRGREKRVRINIDAENYRKKREESLEKLAKKMADKVVQNRRNMMLEPMNSYERHVIHAALQEYPDITTYSTGSEPNRRIVVAYSRYKSK